MRAIVSNPKHPDEYMKMFNGLLKLKMAFSDLAFATINQFNKDHPTEDNELTHILNNLFEHWAGLMPGKNAFDRLLSRILMFQKNDRIETLIKYYRALYAQDLIDGIVKTCDPDARTKLRPYLQALYEASKPIKDATEKMLNQYQSSVVGTDYEMRRLQSNSGYLLSRSEFALGKLTHYIDVYLSDKEMFRQLNDYSWANKTPMKIEKDLSAIEDEIRKHHRFTEKEYNEKLAEAMHSELYMKLDSGFWWERINSGSCDFEAYLSGHCGRGSGDVLFSLRTKDKKTGMLRSHVTIAAKDYDIPKSSKYALEMKSVYEIHEVKGNLNQHPDKEFWPYILQLFLRNEMGWQVPSSYKPESDFNPQNIYMDHPEYKEVIKEFYKIKPWWNDPVNAFLQYEILNKDIAESFKSAHPHAKKIFFEEDGHARNLVVRYEHFYEMLEDIADEHKKIAAIKKTREDYQPHFGSGECKISEGDVDIYLNVMKEDFPETYEIVKNEAKEQGYGSRFDKYILKGEGLAEELRPIMNDASFDGYWSGTEGAMFKATENAFDGLELETDHNEYVGNISKNDEFWDITYDIKQIIDHYVSTEEIGHRRLEFGRGDLEVEWNAEFDDYVAKERFKELMSETEYT